MTESARLLRDLVAIPSINPMGRPLAGPEIFEHRLTAYLEQFFRGLDVPCERQTVAPLRENVIAHFHSPAGKRTWLWEAHQDTVPTDYMTIDPFGARIEGGRLFGRGACDIKGGMSAMLAAFARLVRERPAQADHVTLACTVDEEFTFLGVQRLVQGLKADFAIVAEPTQLQIVYAHKGVVRWNVHTAGRSCHSSSPEKGINAIYRMGRLLEACERYAELLRRSKSDPLLGPPTISVGRVEGGTSVNTVPDRCRIEVDRRILPGEDPAKAPLDFEQYLKSDPAVDFPFQVEQPWMACPALSPDRSAELVELLGQAIQKVQGSFKVMPVPFGTDASTIAAAGIPAVVFGPGDIAQAHTCDEWIALEQLEKASEILFQLATRR
jgi:acetylornithine deacetylase